ncbi:hypothetical protein JRI60_36570 [Archangium violaceum]|jgi:hypothetical protein|uniref:hypothetical protein n=1 Tax=Archangium violaceum TaxID=83451 RepID=UPI0019513C25|nr:hypothetical protein [Archangium violaceum]QRN94602.1 hypothetical protein JRI60_36570 [Archangium violaceum]
MELAYVLVAAIVLLWARSAWKKRRNERLVALRRVEIDERKDVFHWSWTFDFVEMLLVYEYNVYDWPPTESHDLFELRRRDGPTWEMRFHPDTVPEALKDLERSARNPFAEPEHLAKQRAMITDGKWRSVPDDITTTLETRYQLFVRNYDPSVDVEVVPLAVYWRRRLAFQRQREEKEDAAEAARKGTSASPRTSLATGHEKTSA